MSHSCVTFSEVTMFLQIPMLISLLGFSYSKDIHAMVDGLSAAVEQFEAQIKAMEDTDNNLQADLKMIKGV